MQKGSQCKSVSFQMNREEMEAVAVTRGSVPKFLVRPITKATGPPGRAKAKNSPSSAKAKDKPSPAKAETPPKKVAKVESTM